MLLKCQLKTGNLKGRIPLSGPSELKKKTKPKIFELVYASAHTIHCHSTAKQIYI